MRRYVAIAAMLVALTGCGSYIQRVKANGVVCIVSRDEINNHVNDVKCPRPFITNR